MVRRRIVWNQHIEREWDSIVRVDRYNESIWRWKTDSWGVKPVFTPAKFPAYVRRMKIGDAFLVILVFIIFNFFGIIGILHTHSHYSEWAIFED